MIRVKYPAGLPGSGVPYHALARVPSHAWEVWIFPRSDLSRSQAWAVVDADNRARSRRNPWTAAHTLKWHVWFRGGSGRPAATRQGAPSTLEDPTHPKETP